MKECKWLTQRKQTPKDCSELVSRLHHWLKNRDFKLKVEVEAKQLEDVEECTFRPNPDKSVSQPQPTEIYDRNIEWLKLKQNRDKKALEDKYSELLRQFPDKKGKSKNDTFDLLDILKISLKSPVKISNFDASLSL